MRVIWAHQKPQLNLVQLVGLLSLAVPTQPVRQVLLKPRKNLLAVTRVIDGDAIVVEAPARSG